MKSPPTMYDEKNWGDRNVMLYWRGMLEFGIGMINTTFQWYETMDDASVSLIMLDVGGKKRLTNLQKPGWENK